MKPKILSEITGNTHGIRFKMNPPMNPKNRNVARPREGCGILAPGTVGAGLISQACRSLPFSCCAKTMRPGIDDKLLSGDSTGILNVASFGLRDSTLGWPTMMSLLCDTGKKSMAW